MSALTYWYLAGLVAGSGFSLGAYFEPHPSFNVPSDRTWLERFNWMDGHLYKQVATEGYQYDPRAYSNIAFFPVYPLLARGLMPLTGLEAEAALLAVSNASFLAASVLLALYVRNRLGSPPPLAEVGLSRSLPAAGQSAQASSNDTMPAELSDWAVLAAALFPTGCFFRFAYSESTCLLLIVLAMFAMLRRWPLWAIALIVGLATATRPVGVALLAPFALHLWRGPCDGERRPAESDALPRSFHSVGRHWVGRCLPHGSLRSAALRVAFFLPLGCWGLAAFVAYQSYAFGQPLAMASAQSHWRIRPQVSSGEKALALATLEPIRSVYDSQSPAFWENDKHGIPWLSLQFANPLFFLAAVGLVAWGAFQRWLSVDETLLSALLLLIPYLTRAYEMGMRSMGRFVIVVFPIYIVIGQILIRLPRPLAAALLALSAFLLGAYSALYAAGYVIF